MRYVLFFMAVVGYAFASGAEHHVQTDIVPRTVNFIIFAALIYYLLAGKIKEFFASRSDNIASELGKVDEKIEEAKKAKEEALKKVEEAKELAKEIEQTTAKETQMMVEKIKKAYEFESETLQKQKEEVQEVTQNKMIREVVTESLNEVLEIDNIAQNKNELIETLLKKVA